MTPIGRRSAVAAEARKPFSTGAIGLTIALVLNFLAPATAWGGARSTSAEVQNRSLAGIERAEAVYLVLTSELQARLGHSSAAFSLMLDAAKKFRRTELFERAIAMALQEQAGDAALEAATAWGHAFPESSTPLGARLQLMVAMNRVVDSGPLLTKLIQRTDAHERAALIDRVGQVYARIPDRASAQHLLAERLQPWVEERSTKSSALTALARVHRAMGHEQQSRQLLIDALKANPSSESAGLLAIEWAQSGKWAESNSIDAYLDANPRFTNVRMARARQLLAENKPDQAEHHLKIINSTSPEIGDAWLALGLLRLQNGDERAARGYLENYLLRTEANSKTDIRGRSQAALALAQISQSQNNWTAAHAWLERVIDPEFSERALTARVSLLTSEGKFDEAMDAAKTAGDVEPGAKRRGYVLEAGVWRSQKKWLEAYRAMMKAVELAADDTDLLYDAAMLAERAGKPADMESMLRKIISIDASHHHALNALGYALADRNERLDEARQLIERAMELAPNDAYITDSLGWLEFRLGNLEAAEKHLRRALDIKFDAEIATHLGEVLWIRGRRADALLLFQRARESQPDNETLKGTLSRLGVPL